MAESKNVTRIKATDTAAKNTAGDKAVKATKAVKASNVPSKAPKKPRVAKEPSNLITQALFAIGRYFKGAWLELKQVRWPTRKSTWGLTLAVILFSIFFIVIILLLDAFFKFVFELMIK